MQGLTEGRIVHFVLSNGKHRPAIVVKVWMEEGAGEGACNLRVFTDSSEFATFNGPFPYIGPLPEIMWKESVEYSEEKRPGTWHWIEQA